MDREYIYDGTFPGFLTAIFDSYKFKEQPEAIVRKGGTETLFAEKHEVITEIEKSERVWNGIIKNGGEKTGNHIYYAFLSRETGIEIVLYQYISRIFSEKRSIMDDLAAPQVLKVHKLYRKVAFEAHRVTMFLRFEQAADGTYFAPYAPKYDIISLTLKHFKMRFADQRWLIYDTIRDYGYYYDTKKIEQVVITHPEFNFDTGQLHYKAKHPDDEKWQDLWRTYFKKIAISERKNLVLQRNFMPKRFWKYLTEKGSNSLGLRK